MHSKSLLSSLPVPEPAFLEDRDGKMRSLLEPQEAHRLVNGMECRDWCPFSDNHAYYITLTQTL